MVLHRDVLHGDRALRDSPVDDRWVKWTDRWDSVLKGMGKVDTGEKWVRPQQYNCLQSF